MFGHLQALDSFARRKVVGERVEEIVDLLGVDITGDDFGLGLVAGLQRAAENYVESVTLMTAQEKKKDLIRGNSLDEREHVKKLYALGEIRELSHKALIDNINPLQRYLLACRAKINAAGKQMPHGGILPVNPVIQLSHGVIMVSYDDPRDRFPISEWAGDVVLYQKHRNGGNA